MSCLWSSDTACKEGSLIALFDYKWAGKLSCARVVKATAMFQNRVMWQPSPCNNNWNNINTSTYRRCQIQLKAFTCPESFQTDRHQIKRLGMRLLVYDCLCPGAQFRVFACCLFAAFPRRRLESFDASSPRTWVCTNTRSAPPAVTHSWLPRQQSATLDFRS